ncbi:MAG: alkaline phosphatase family protein [Gammaproteobacteria bacterium]|nr:alkaline phosphatase family protein [Gammaproteobacteria bacterium]
MHSEARPDWLHLPDYAGHGIVNLMASLAEACQAPATGYPGLSGNLLNDVSRANNIVLLVIDGLGYDYLLRRCQGSLLSSYCRARLTSVCPSTTTSAIPTFLTGRPPQQHGFTGWFTYFSELGSILAVLPFCTRVGGRSIDDALLSPAALCGVAPLFATMQLRSNLIMPDRIAYSSFNRAFSGNASIIPYAGFRGLQRALRRVLRGSRERSFSYAYWPDFDSLAHRFGVDSPQVQDHFQLLDSLFADLVAHLPGSDSLLLVTSDHGFIDTADTTIDMEAHPELKELLLVPLCGEPRLAFCYLHPGREAAFEAYVRENFSRQIELLPSNLLLQQGWFGRGQLHPQLASRIGQYALVMQENWAITDTVPGERALQQIGVHGGVSHQEMYVPLIIVEG